MSFRIYYHPNAVNDRQKYTLIKASLSKTRREGVISDDDALFLLAGCHAQNRAMFERRLKSTDAPPTHRVSIERYCVSIRPITKNKGSHARIERITDVDRVRHRSVTLHCANKDCTAVPVYWAVFECPTSATKRQTPRRRALCPDCAAKYAERSGIKPPEVAL